MLNADVETEEPVDGSSSVDAPEPLTPKGYRRSFGKVRRELNETELGSPGVQKMLLDEIDRLEEIERDYSSISLKYADVVSRKSALEERVRALSSIDLVSTTTISVSSIIFGVAFNIKNNGLLLAAILLLSSVLIFVGVAAKVKSHES